MEKPNDPIIIATDATYSSGPNIGDNTKTAPDAGLLAQGFMPDEEPAVDHFNAIQHNFGTNLQFLHGLPELYEATASESIDLTTADWSWVNLIYVELVGGGGSGGNGNGTTTAGGGGGSGRKASGWLRIDRDNDSTLGLEVGQGGVASGTGIGGISRVRYGTPQHTIMALGGQPGTLGDGGDGYSGGGSAGGAGGSLGSDGTTADGTGGSGQRGVLGSGEGIEIAAAPGAGGLAGGGGGAAGHWRDVEAGVGGGVGGAEGGVGGTGVGAGGGGGGGGLSGDGGTGADGAIRIWKYRGTP